MTISLSLSMSDNPKMKDASEDNKNGGESVGKNVHCQTLPLCETLFILFTKQ